MLRCILHEQLELVYASIFQAVCNAVVVNCWLQYVVVFQVNDSPLFSDSLLVEISYFFQENNTLLFSDDSCPYL